MLYFHNPHERHKGLDRFKAANQAEFLKFQHAMQDYFEDYYKTLFSDRPAFLKNYFQESIQIGGPQLSLRKINKLFDLNQEDNTSLNPENREKSVRFVTACAGAILPKIYSALGDFDDYLRPLELINDLWDITVKFSLYAEEIEGELFTAEAETQSSLEKDLEDINSSSFNYLNKCVLHYAEAYISDIYPFVSEGIFNHLLNEFNKQLSSILYSNIQSLKSRPNNGLSELEIDACSILAGKTYTFLLPLMFRSQLDDLHLESLQSISMFAGKIREAAVDFCRKSSRFEVEFIKKSFRTKNAGDLILGQADLDSLCALIVYTARHAYAQQVDSALFLREDLEEAVTNNIDKTYQRIYLAALYTDLPAFNLNEAKLLKGLASNKTFEVSEQTDFGSDNLSQNNTWEEVYFNKKRLLVTPLILNEVYLGSHVTIYDKKDQVKDKYIRSYADDMSRAIVALLRSKKLGLLD